MDVVITRLNHGAVVFEKTTPVNFRDQLQVAHVVCRVQDFVVSAAGWYGVELLADREFVAQARFEVVQRRTAQ